MALDGACPSSRQDLEAKPHCFGRVSETSSSSTTGMNRDEVRRGIPHPRQLVYCLPQEETTEGIQRQVIYIKLFSAFPSKIDLNLL